MTGSSLGIFGLLLYLLKRWKASVVSYQNVLSPPVAILLSLWLLGEPVSGSLALGGALVLLGLYVGVLAPERLSSPVLSDHGSRDTLDEKRHAA